MLRRGRRIIFPEYSVAAGVRTASGSGTCGVGGDFVCHNRGDSFWDTALEAGETGPDALWDDGVVK